MRKILLVEDEDILREAYSTILSAEPYLIHTAINGLEALEKSNKTIYDLILLDLMMPILDGIGFLERFAATPHFTSTKVIVLSNLSSGKEIKEALSLGAYKNVLKSDLTPRQLLATVRYEVETA